jgi:hypothetical protein
VVKGTEKQYISEFLKTITVSLTQRGKGSTGENFSDSRWMECRYYKSFVPWDDGPLDRSEGRNVEVEIGSGWV